MQEQKTYHEIPYRDTSLPAISIWEYRKVVSKLKENQIQVNEIAIFEAYRELNNIESKAIRETKSVKRFCHKEETIKSKESEEKLNFEEEIVETISIDIEPFEDIDDEAYNR